MKNIYKKNGQLSAYGYACGYVNRIECNITGLRKSLYQESGVYHVRTNVDMPKKWQSFHTLQDALKHFKSININKK